MEGRKINRKFLGVDLKTWIVVAMVMGLITLVILANPAMACPKETTWGGIKWIFH